MISDVRLDGFTTNEIPWKFEAGTPPIAEAIGLGAAVDYLEAVGIEAITAHEKALTAHTIAALTSSFDELTVFGPDPSVTDRSGVISFAFGDVHPHDVAQILDENGVCVRAGHHCAKPLMRRLGVGATTRASLYLYNDEDDIEALIVGLDAVRKLFN
jgi:cysteine desulfurase/selenocysteine lyase